MRNVLSILILSALIITGLLAERAEAGKVPNGCFVAIVKIAPGGGDVLFDFLAVNSGEETNFTLSGNSGTAGFLSVGETLTVTEFPEEGWELQGISCDSDVGLITSVDGNSLIATCVSIGGAAECAFRNLQLSNIPTLSEWGMIAAAGAMLLAGAFYAVRRRKAAA